MAHAASCALIVEGTHGIGKSTLIDALTRRHVAVSGVRRILENDAEDEACASTAYDWWVASGTGAGV